MRTEHSTISKTRKHFWNRKKEKELTLDDITIVDNSMLKRAVGATALGNAMEWFDFGVYSYLAVTIGKVFFPSHQYRSTAYCRFCCLRCRFSYSSGGRPLLWPSG